MDDGVKTTRGKKRERPSALARAAAYLARRLVSEHRLRQYLHEKKYSQDEIDAALTQLLEGGYLNDARLAESRARYLIEARGYWGWALAARLSGEGFGEGEREAALRRAGAEFDAERLARSLLERRYGERWRESAPRRFAGFLERHGFPAELIVRLVREAKRP